MTFQKNNHKINPKKSTCEFHSCYLKIQSKLRTAQQIKFKLNRKQNECLKFKNMNYLAIN